jgi:hypothetical protein
MESEEKTSPGSGKPDGSGKDYSRQLGVVESLMAITNQCPSAAVRKVAEQALDAVKTGGADELRTQVYFVLTAMKGWRGERARQVHESLNAFLEGGAPESGTNEPAREGSAAVSNGDPRDDSENPR